MITLYGVLLFLHVLGAILWIGAHATSIALRLLAIRSGDRARIATAVDTDRLGPHGDRGDPLTRSSGPHSPPWVGTRNRPPATHFEPTAGKRAPV